MFERIIADAGYESAENYLYLKETEQQCFIKPQNYEISKKKTYKANPFSVENMEYNEKRKKRSTLVLFGRRLIAFLFRNIFLKKDSWQFFAKSKPFDKLIKK